MHSPHWLSNCLVCCRGGVSSLTSVGGVAIVCTVTARTASPNITRCLSSSYVFGCHALSVQPLSRHRWDRYSTHRAKALSMGGYSSLFSSLRVRRILRGVVRRNSLELRRSFQLTRAHRLGEFTRTHFVSRVVQFRQSGLLARIPDLYSM